MQNLLGRFLAKMELEIKVLERLPPCIICGGNFILFKTSHIYNNDKYLPEIAVLSFKTRNSV